MVLQAVDAAGYLYLVDVEPAQQQRGHPAALNPRQDDAHGPALRACPPPVHGRVTIASGAPSWRKVGPVPISLNSEVSRKGGNDNHVEAPKCR